ncbi:uncharacterized protein KGF55_003429 [Candida pseudojiufengensis]|uniref:uncharacterized protein n=1 Tax=Candida pseudojiufengensis TaxID=497109 RepID=UPI0022243931|nr:uncharacterized protein KGF55_003429 [Candida pseudojiufengensis]KAI5962353.1 hypothetical protein KGF55_003429 [Candida pseudojiufengensis]
MSLIKNTTRSISALFSTLYLVLIILTIPLAFDVGGVNCGLAFSLTTMVIYFILTTIRLIARRTRYFKWISMIYYSQHFFIPSILTYFLSYYNTNVISNSKYNPVEIWKFLLINATPIFTILEGFCSLLLIQAIGQTISWLTIYRSDSWLIISLIGSALVDTGAFYFLYRIYVFPFTIDMVSASLLGSLLTMTIGLCLFGIVSGKGSMIESSLLFAYIVRCIYETFPILSEGASAALTNLLTQATQNVRKEIPKIPPSILNPISEVVPFLASTLPLSFKGVWEFLVMAIHNLTLPLLLNLAYRIGVFYAATKIIPSLYQSVSYPTVTPPKTPQPRSRQTSSSAISEMINNENENEDQNLLKDERVPLKSRKSFHLKPPHHQPPSAIIRLIYAYSPCLIIAVYSHLMLSYIGELGTELQIWPLWGVSQNTLIVHPWKFWNWVNMVTTLVLYVAELSNNDSSSGGGNSLTSHWKVE